MTKADEIFNKFMDGQLEMHLVNDIAHSMNNYINIQRTAKVHEAITFAVEEMTSMNYDTQIQEYKDHLESHKEFNSVICMYCKIENGHKES